MRRGFRPRPWIVRRDSGSSVAATRNGAAAEKSPGTSTCGRRRRSAGLTVTLVRAAPDARPGRGQHQLGVVARRQRLDDGRLALGVEAREQDARLHLRARDRQLVRDALERAALDRERRRALGRLDPRAHAAQRLGDPLHRALRERLVAGEREACPPGRRAGREAGASACRRCRSRSGLAALRGRAGRARGRSACRRRARRPRRRALGPRRAWPRCRRSGRSPRRASPPRSTAPRSTRAVRDRLVARDADVPLDGDRRLDPHSSGATSTP